MPHHCSPSRKGDSLSLRLIPAYLLPVTLLAAPDHHTSFALLVESALAGSLCRHLIAPDDQHLLRREMLQPPVDLEGVHPTSEVRPEIGHIMIV